MEDLWRETWGKRSVNVDEQGVLSALINANGFDQGCGAYTPDQWLAMAEAWSQPLALESGGHVLEVGCGAGAFLYALQQKTGIKPYGYDYSAPLIESAKKYIIGDFFVSEAVVNPFAGQSFDAVVSHSVFHYFPDLDYAFTVVNEMARSLSSRGRIALLDLNDAAHELEYHAERMKGYGSAEEYREKYRNHKHLFFSKEMISKWLEQCGIADLEFVPHPIDGYGNARFRFNVIGRKTEK